MIQNRSSFSLSIAQITADDHHISIIVWKISLTTQLSLVQKTVISCCFIYPAVSVRLRCRNALVLCGVLHSDQRDEVQLTRTSFTKVSSTISVISIHFNSLSCDSSAPRSISPISMLPAPPSPSLTSSLPLLLSGRQRMLVYPHPLHLAHLLDLIVHLQKILLRKSRKCSRVVAVIHASSWLELPAVQKKW